MLNKISIIIPIYNSAKHLKKCLVSVLNQSYKNIEVILVNDGSLDNSLDICKSYDDKRIKIINNTNHGTSYSRNCGIKKATGDYIMFVDSDDVIHKDMCKILINNLLEYKADLSVCSYEEVTDVASFNKIGKNILINEKKYISLFTLYKGFVWNKLYKKNVIVDNNINFQDNITMGEDMLFNFNYLKYTNYVIYTDKKLYGYVIHNDNISKKINQKWFSFLNVYGGIYKNILDYDLNTQNVILLNYFYTIFEARCRCDILNISFQKILKEFDIDYNFLVKKYYKRLILAKNIKFLDKFKLFIFTKLYFISAIIKKRKLLK